MQLFGHEKYKNATKNWFKYLVNNTNNKETNQVSKKIKKKKLFYVTVYLICSLWSYFTSKPLKN